MSSKSHDFASETAVEGEGAREANWRRQAYHFYRFPYETFKFTNSFQRIVQVGTRLEHSPRSISVLLNIPRFLPTLCHITIFFQTRYKVHTARKTVFGSSIRYKSRRTISGSRILSNCRPRFDARMFERRQKCFPRE